MSAESVRARINAGRAPRFRGDCRLSNLVEMGGLAVCYFPSEHQGSCGVDPMPVSMTCYMLTGRARPKRDGFDDKGRALP